MNMLSVNTTGPMFGTPENMDFMIQDKPNE